MDDTMTTPTAEASSEQGRPQGPEHEGDLGDRLRESVFHAIGHWATEHLGGNPEVAKAKLAAYERVHEAMRDGDWRKDLHGMGRPLVELDAHLTQWIDDRRTDIFRVVQTVAGTEAPLILIVPATLPGHIDATMARASGWLGEKAVRFNNWGGDMLTGAMASVRGGGQKAYEWILSPGGTA